MHNGQKYALNSLIKETKLPIQQQSISKFKSSDFELKQHEKKTWKMKTTKHDKKSVKLFCFLAKIHSGTKTWNMKMVGTTGWTNKFWIIGKPHLDIFEAIFGLFEAIWGYSGILRSFKVILEHWGHLWQLRSFEAIEVIIEHWGHLRPLRLLKADEVIKYHWAFEVIEGQWGH